VKLSEMTVREIEAHLYAQGCESIPVAKHTAMLLHKSYHMVDQRDVVDSIKQLITTIKT